jgi:hypothetical protein
MTVDDFVGARVLALANEIKCRNGKGCAPQTSNPIVTEPKQKKPMEYRLIVSLVTLGIGVYMIVRGLTEAGIALISATAGYWIR